MNEANGVMRVDLERRLTEAERRLREVEVERDAGHEREDEARERESATAEILRIIATSPGDPQQVFDAIVESARRLLGGYSAAMERIEGDQTHLQASTSVDPAADAAMRTTFPRPVPEFFARALRDGFAEIVDTETELQGPSLAHARAREVRSFIMVLLKVGGENFGTLAVSRREPGRFAPLQIQLLRTFADQAVIAIENARLFNETKEALAQQTATADVLKVISRSAFGIKTVLQALVDSAVRLCASDGVIYLRHGNEFRAGAAFGALSPGHDSKQRSPRRPGRDSITGRVALSGNVEQIPDNLADPEFKVVDSQRMKMRSLLGVPLIRDGAVEGVFVLGRPEPGLFADRAVELAQTFADQAVIAIENTRLFEEVQARTRDLTEALQQQTATSDVLQVISRSAFDLDTVFQTLVKTAVDLCKASSGTLCVRDGDVYRYRGMAGPESTPALQRYLEDHPLVAPTRGTAAGRAILSRQVEEISDVLREVDYIVPFAAHGSPARSLLGVPLLGKTEVLGAIVVARAEPGDFPQRHVEILKTFADQAVIAIENARLFEEVQARTRELEQSLDDLRRAQDRLVQSEKLASLGQLTAGIAHEIKNPLNFVNNFASLSRELLGEMREMLAALPPAPRADADELMGMLDSNLDKVVHHGKRADSIVKNMLLHAREGSGERAQVKVNAMVEEALNLAYHGARAEKPDFKVTIDKSLDPNAGVADLYPQEMTRVLLNLISNGFYATAKRRQKRSDAGYEPTISASTRDLGERIEVAIRDNGTGIPEEVKDKIFNPFFTTKPAGEGTGLGLSLSHDIVVKQHGGTLEVATEPGVYTQFTIVLPRANCSQEAVRVQS